MTSRSETGADALGRLLLQLYPSRLVGVILCGTAVLGFVRPEHRVQLAPVSAVIGVIGVCLFTHRVTLHQDGIRSCFGLGLGARQVRLSEVVTLGSPVPWSKSVTFTPDGLEVIPRRLFLFRGAKMLVPYGSEIFFELGKGTLTVLRDGEGVCTFQRGAPNFYAGFALFQQLRQRAASTHRTKRAVPT